MSTPRRAATTDSAAGLRAEEWSSVRRVLAVRLDALGDVLMTSPALHAAKGVHGERHVTLLTSASGAEAGRLVPDVDETWVYDAPWVKSTEPRDDSGADHRIVRKLAEGRFDAAVIFTVYSQNPLPAALMCHLAGIPRRLAHCRENPYQLLTDWRSEIEPNQRVRHEARRQLDLVASVGWRADDERLRLTVPSAARARVAALLRELRLDRDGPWAVVHAGASAPSRRYAPERFARVIRALTGTHGWRVVMTGSHQERRLLERLTQGSNGRAVSLAGRLDLGMLAALLARAPLLISNNTGPVHVAAAVGTPVVDLYALTNPQHTPWQVPNRVLYHDVPCRICYRSVCPEGHHLCLDGVAPERVVAAALELARAPRRPETAVARIAVPPPDPASAELAQ